MAEHSFLSTWCLTAPIERVWEQLSAPDRYPQWWNGVRDATVLEPGADGDHGVGTLYRMQWRATLPTTLEFDSRVTRVQAPYLLEARVSGALAGLGVWRLYESPAGTVALYEWDVSTARRPAPIAGRTLTWTHHAVMRHGAVSLAEKLGAELVASS